MSKGTLPILKFQDNNNYSLNAHHNYDNTLRALGRRMASLNNSDDAM